MGGALVVGVAVLVVTGGGVVVVLVGGVVVLVVTGGGLVVVGIVVLVVTGGGLMVVGMVVLVVTGGGVVVIGPPVAGGGVGVGITTMHEDARNTIANSNVSKLKIHVDLFLPESLIKTPCPSSDIVHFTSICNVLNICA